MTDLTQELERVSQPETVRTVADLIETMRPALVKSLGTETMADALTRHYYTAIRYTPALLECSPDSLIAALLLSAQVRLEPGPLGHVYLVPYKRECVWMLGYTGIMELARRSDQVAGLQASVVHDGDVYETPWQDEKGWHWQYRPGRDADRGERYAVLVTWKERTGSVWTPRALHVAPERVETAQKASASYRSGKGPWFDHPEAMWRKTGIRAARPWLPLTTEAGVAFAADERTVTGVQVTPEGEAVPMIEAGDES